MASNSEHTELAAPTFKEPVKVLIVVAPFYRAIADDLIAGASAALKDAGAKFEIVEVPGALEIPPAIRIAERQSNFDGFVALGCVIRGATSHYETVCADSSGGLMTLGLEGLCIGNGILTVENSEQAEERADPKRMNKGAGAAIAALHLIALTRKWGRSGRGVGFKPETYLVAGKDEGTTTA